MLFRVEAERRLSLTSRPENVPGKPDTGAVERLAALHRAGDLDDEEFSAAKRGLLGSGHRTPFHWPLLGGAAIGLSVGVLGLLAWEQVGRTSAPRTANSTNATQSSPSNATAGVMQPASTLQGLFRRDMLDAQVVYLEHMIGPPRNVSGGERTYIVDGCEVTVSVSGSAIASIGLPHLSPACTVSLSDFGFDGPTAYKLTFGTLDSIALTTAFTADCIDSCGNAYDPSVYATVDTPHSDDYLTFKPGVELVSDAAIDASTKWSNAMRGAEGEDYVVQTKFNCDRKYDDLAHQFFKNVPISSIEVGRIAHPKSCQSAHA